MTDHVAAMKARAERGLQAGDIARYVGPGDERIVQIVAYNPRGWFVCLTPVELFDTEYTIEMGFPGDHLDPVIEP